MKVITKSLGVMMALSGFLVVSCNNPTDTERPGETTVETVVPVNKFVAEQSTDIGNDKIKYSYSYDGYDFYYIHLGKLKNIPVFYYEAERHNGINSTYSVSREYATRTKIVETVTSSNEMVIDVVDVNTTSKTSNVKLNQEINAKFPIKFISVGVKAAAEEEWANYTFNSTTNGFRETTSLTNTITHATEYTYGSTITRSWILNENNKSGYYRYTLFSSSDIYLYVIKDSTGAIDYEFREYVIPDVSGTKGYFWDLDYSENPYFIKNDSTGFELDVSILDNLPKPVVILKTLAPSNVSAFAESPNSIVVEWNSVIVADSYEIHRSTNENGTYSLVGTSSSTSYTDTELSEATTYYYKIKAVTNHGSSEFSSCVSATTTKFKTIIDTFTVNYIHTFDKGFPATVEIYALGGGGGGQGGYEWDIQGSSSSNIMGTGGGGGGGAAAYAKFNITSLTTFNITVGSGGTGGNYEWHDGDCGGFLWLTCDYLSDWRSGYPGASGGNSTVTFTLAGNPRIITAGGGGRAADNRPATGHSQILSGGIGGTANINHITELLDHLTSNGNPGGTGRSNSSTRGSGGATGSINIGSFGLFPGALGGGTGGDGGTGGTGGYTFESGKNGAAGKVVVITKYPEKL